MIVNQTIEVRVAEGRGRTVKLGFTFPQDASVVREEVFIAIKEANQAAVEAAQALPPIGKAGADGS